MVGFDTWFLAFMAFVQYMRKIYGFFFFFFPKSASQVQCCMISLLTKIKINLYAKAGTNWVKQGIQVQKSVYEFDGDPVWDKLKNEKWHLTLFLLCIHFIFKTVVESAYAAAAALIERFCIHLNPMKWTKNGVWQFWYYSQFHGLGRHRVKMNLRNILSLLPF